jgi:hypothetical protein
MSLQNHPLRIHPHDRYLVCVSLTTTLEFNHKLRLYIDIRTARKMMQILSLSRTCSCKGASAKVQG